nr:M48 family metallopeptidase [uncultured Desulfuromonas sp.]
MENLLFYLILVILIADYGLERLLDLLNVSWMGRVPPVELQGLYDSEKYIAQQNYQKATSRFGLVTSTFNVLMILLFLFFNGFAWLHGLVSQLSSDGVIQTLLFFGVLWLGQDILSIPFELYQTFVIEQRFGFNTMDGKMFVSDKIKGWLLTLIIGGVILAGITWFYYQTRQLFWLYGWLMVSGLSIFFSLFYANLIVPFFNQQTKLETGELKEAIDAFAAKVAFPVRDIYVLDGSKRSTKANAYFTGFGAKKRIVLFDTLIRDLTTREVVAVLAHEVGHYKNRHTLQGIFFSVVQTGVIFFLLSLFLEKAIFCRALGVDDVVFHVGLVAFTLLYRPLSLLIGLLVHLWSRRNEYQADAFAAQYHNADYLINALKKLSLNHLSNLTPHPIYVFFYYSHPSLSQRIKALRSSCS